MKNLFKKSTNKETKVTIQKIDKKQLEKVVGGTETTTATTTTTVRQIATSEGPR
jgi:hypothetical protein